jgi:hypothetical protein
MPSPRGTNHAGLFLVSNPAGAYDAMPDDQAAALILFLKERLTDADFSEACRIGKLDEGVTMDRRPAMDAATNAAFARRWPHAAKIGHSY